MVQAPILDDSSALIMSRRLYLNSVSYINSGRNSRIEILKNPVAYIQSRRLYSLGRDSSMVFNENLGA